jgi:outer membrane lipoprotein-sorting protein
MKNTILHLLLIVGISFNAFAQKDKQAKTILNQVSEKYKSFPFIKSDFTFTIDDQQANIKQTQNGTLITQSKTNKFKVILYDAAAKTGIEQEITNDGKTQWTYVKKDKETEVSDADHSGEGFNPAQLFTLWEHGYKYLYTGEQKVNGTVCQVIELTPEDEKKTFFKIRLFIDKAKKQIFNALIFDRNGSKYSYTLRSFTTMAQMPDNTFTYDAKAHPGVEVVDLR